MKWRDSVSGRSESTDLRFNGRNIIFVGVCPPSRADSRCWLNISARGCWSDPR